MANLIGTTKFVTIFAISLSDGLINFLPSFLVNNNQYILSVPVGVLAYPITFIATDLIAEFYGKQKAQKLVLTGFAMNVFMLIMMTIANLLTDSAGISGGNEIFSGVYKFMIANTIASMIAYLIAQSIDIQIFHFLKKKTRGKKLWLRNNVSTMISQLIDSIIVILIIYFAGNLSDNINSIGMLILLIFNAYIFKFFFAIFDTPIIYLLASYLNSNFEPSRNYSNKYKRNNTRYRNQDRNRSSKNNKPPLKSKRY